MEVIRELVKEDEIVVAEKGYSVFKNPHFTHICLLAVRTRGQDSYERYYGINKADYDLCVRDKNKFYDRFKETIDQCKNGLFGAKGANFLGSQSLRDYDCDYSLDLVKALPINGYLIYNAFLYAATEYNGEEVYIPILRWCEKNEFNIFWRYNCQLVTDENGIPLFYKKRNGRNGSESSKELKNVLIQEEKERERDLLYDKTTEF